MEYERLERQAVEALQECLREVPFLYGQKIGSESAAGEYGAGLLARLELPQGEQVLLVEVKAVGQPRQIREAANQFYRLRERWPGAYPVIVAPYISPAAAEICAREGVGYLDLAGNCRLAFGQVYIEKEGNPNPAPRKRQLRSLYAPRASRVLRVLLAEPARPWRMQSLAREAGVSLGQAANVKRLLADREWIRTGPEGFALAEPEALLEEWSSAYSRRNSLAHDYYTLRQTAEFERALAEVCREEGWRCALTAFSAGARLAPMVRGQRAVAYVEGDLERLARRLELKQVESGANVRLLVPYDEGVFYGCQEHDGVPVVSPVQAWLDLQGAGGRSEEAARALLEEVIKPTWPQPV